jgi:hypothetical protein
MFSEAWIPHLCLRRKTVPTIQLVIIQGHQEHIPSRQRAILLTKQKEHTYGQDP